MNDTSKLSSRKADHIKINLEQDVQSALTTGLEKYRFVHEALPDLNLNEIDISQMLFGRRLAAPILISSMTGGTVEAQSINLILARAAQETGVAMGVGSQRAGIEHPELAATFQVRQVAPDILLFANLGAVQLNYQYTINQCRRAVEMIGADALILHLNPLQEALQPEGDTQFSGLLQKIEQVCKHLGVPVIAKEVGWGISAVTARRLADAGIAGLDVAGAGGTSWSQVEMHRIRAPKMVQVAAAFRGWGLPTAESIQMARAGAPDLPVIASGGLKDGIDIAKCIALGARLGGLAAYFLRAAVQSYKLTVDAIDILRREILVCMFASGAGNLEQLRQTPLIKE